MRNPGFYLALPARHGRLGSCPRLQTLPRILAPMQAEPERLTRDEAGDRVRITLSGALMTRPTQPAGARASFKHGVDVESQVTV
jgi:hypothetical protein